MLVTVAWTQPPAVEPLRVGIRAEAERQVVTQFGRLNAEAAKWRVKIEQAEKRLASVRVMLADGQITPGDFREMRETFESELLTAKSQLAEAQQAMENADGLVLKICDLLKNVGSLFASASPSRKTQILKTFFPCGFSILDGKVRTLGINQVVAEICSQSISYELIEIKNDTPETECVIRGGKADEDRTRLHHANLLRNLLAA